MIQKYNSSIKNHSLYESRKQYVLTAKTIFCNPCTTSTRYNVTIVEFYTPVKITRVVNLRVLESTQCDATVAPGGSSATSNYDKTRASDRSRPPGQWGRVDLRCSNILFSAESTPHRVPIGPERPTVLQVIVTLGWPRRSLPMFVPAIRSSSETEDDRSKTIGTANE